jgi:hypothetical protein
VFLVDEVSVHDASTMRWLAWVGAALAIPLTAGTAAAQQNGSSAAQSVGDGWVKALLPRVCDGGDTAAGFFGHHASYLAACGSKDRGFEAFFIINAKAGPLNVKSKIMSDELTFFCSQGSAYGFGVRGKFMSVFAGIGGTPANIARAQRDAFANSVSKRTPGYIKPFRAC